MGCGGSQLVLRLALLPLAALLGALFLQRLAGGGGYDSGHQGGGQGDGGGAPTPSTPVSDDDIPF